MTSRDEFDQDDALRAVLAAADPARSLPTADPASLAVLLQEVMGTGSAEAPRRRTRLTWLVAAAAAVVIAGVGGYAATSSGGDDRAPAAAPAPAATSSSAAPTPPTPGGSDLPVPGTTTLSAQAYEGRCARVTPAFIAAQQQAFAATVTSVSDGTVTLQTSQVFAGVVAQTVQVQAPPADLRALVEATDFEVGDSYLVAASDGLVAQCGFTGKAKGELQSLYEKAFTR